jgi:inorganic pyrophosphatase
MPGARAAARTDQSPRHRLDDHDRDSGASDDKVIAVATNDPEFNSYVEANELPPHRLLVLKRFFQDYKQLEGKQVQVEDIRPAYAAVKVIENALARYNKERDRLRSKDGRG